MLFVYPATQAVFFKAMWLPLHTGVILFVLLSGYWGIRPSSKGLIKLLGIFIVYNLSEVVYNVVTAGSVRSMLHSALFFSSSHFWYVKTYLFLYLVSPILNAWKEKASRKQMCYSIAALGLVCIYMATTGGDESMVTGKNLVNFSFLYLVGYQIKELNLRWEKVSIKTLTILYLVFNLLLVVGYCLFEETAIGKIIWRLNFPYSSPLLLVNSIILFIFFGKLKIQSQSINWMAKSSLAIYLIHANRPYIIGIIGIMSTWLISLTDNTIIITAGCILLAIVAIIAAIGLDKLLTPIWTQIEKLGITVYNKLGY